MKLAIVGTQGIPNTYGGFETLAEYLVKYLSKDISITVYCSSVDNKVRYKECDGAKLIYIPLSSHGSMGMIYDSLSLLHAVLTNDKVLFLGFGAGFIAPLLRPFKHKIILNFGGLDWKRNKWSKRAQKIIKTCEQLLVKNTQTVIADNEGIKSYIQEEYRIDAPLIAYGGDQATHKPITDDAIQKYPFLKNEYAFTVTRIQSDNNIEMMLKGFEDSDQMPFVIVGNWNSSDYGKWIKKEYSNKKNLILLDAIYNREELDILRSNCKVYIHGHSAGGTNPSLAEAMFLGLPVLAFSSGYNEYTTHKKALYFNNEIELKESIKNISAVDLSKLGSDLKSIAKIHYLWGKIAEQYKEVISN